METLLEKLKKYAASDALPMHMPGHKRNADAFPWLALLGGDLDITEIGGFDNLNQPEGLFRELETRAAALWGAGESICLVNGSTGGVLTAVRAALERGGALLMARGSHKSVYHAAEIVGAEVHYIVPQTDPVFGVWGSVTPEEVAKALDAHPGVRLVAITSPTYEGVISDVRGIAEACHARGAALFVDEAHGAHLGFGGFPESAVRCGADLVVQSLHKTLPCLTQTAVLHVNGGRVDPADVRRNAAMFQSSSPSYLLSASIDGCVNYLEQEGAAAAERWRGLLKEFYESVRDLQNLQVLEDEKCFFARDPSKLVVSAAGTDLDGAGLMALLREQFHIELEMAHGNYVVAMTGMGDTRESLRRFSQALHEIDKSCRKTETPAKPREFILPEKRLSIHEAITAAGRFCPVAEAVGKVSGEYVWAYPPGTPLLVPGEVLDAQTVQAVLLGAGLHSTRGGVPERIFCIDTQP